LNIKVNKRVTCIDLGVIDYKEAWDYQESLFKQIVDIKIANRKSAENEQQATPNYLLFCEHPHVYTLGKSGDKKHLLLNESQLEAKQAKYYHINRGGDITYHGPGQLVGYPILDLENFFTDIHKYLRCLEQAVIDTLDIYGIEAGRIEGYTGVWLDHINQINPRKICAMGVKTSRWVTMHGLALNVNANTDYFNYIVPCGIADKAVTSMHMELNRQLDMQEVRDALKEQIGALFAMDLNAGT